MTVVCNCWCRIHHVTHVKIHTGAQKEKRKEGKRYWRRLTEGGAKFVRRTDGRTKTSPTTQTDWTRQPSPQHLLFSPLHLRTNFHNFYFYFFKIFDFSATFLVIRLEKKKRWRQEFLKIKVEGWNITTLSPPFICFLKSSSSFQGLSTGKLAELFFSPMTPVTIRKNSFLFYFILLLSRATHSTRCKLSLDSPSLYTRSGIYK